MSKKILKKKQKKGGMATIIITIVLILTVLVSIPMWKGYSNSNVNQSNKSLRIMNDYSTTIDDFVTNNNGGSLENPFKN